MVAGARVFFSLYDELCVNNDGFFFKNDEFCIKEHGLNDHADRLEAVAKQAAAAAGDATATPEMATNHGLEINLPTVVAELSNVFERYEVALDANDVEGLDGFFWRSSHTTRLANSQHGYGFVSAAQHSPP